MKKTANVAILLLLFQPALMADPGDTLWTRLYGGAGQDFALSLGITHDGGFIAAGSTSSFGNGGQDFYLVRLNSDGDTLWTRAYGGTEDDIASSIMETSDSGFIAAGRTESYGAGASDVFLLKTDSSGEVSWYRTFGGAQDDSAKCVRQTTDGGYVVCGSTESFGGGSTSDIYVVKTDAHGWPLWEHRSGGIIDDGATSIIQTSDNGYMLAGWTGGGDGNHDIYIEKLDSSGNTEWYRGYHPGVDNQAYSIIQTDDGNFVAAGYTFGPSDLLDFYLMKIGPLGNLIWERSCGGPLWEMAHCVRESPDGGLVIAGSRWVSIFPDTTEIYLVRADQNGNRLWDRAYGFGHLNEGAAVEVPDNGDYLLAGYTSLWDYISYDLCLIMAQGDPITSAEDDIGVIPDQASIDAYPNPFNARVAISYYLPANCHVRIEVYDILGRNIVELSNGWQAAGRYTVVWDASNQPSGSYFCRLRAGKTDKVVPLTAIK